MAMVAVWMYVNKGYDPLLNIIQIGLTLNNDQTY